MSLVLDASMTIAWLLDDENTKAVAAIIERVVEGGASVPSLWRLEVANVLRNAVKRGRCGGAYADLALQRLGALMIVVDPETDARAWSDTRGLALSENLTVYDAAYLELALRSRQPLATCDADLIAAARRKDVEVLTI